MSTPLVIVNPAAGRGQVGLRIAEIQSLLHRRGLEGPLVTEGPGHATLLARQAPPGSRVVAVGGDGTVHEVLQGLVGSDKILGVVPIGSGNDFARLAHLHRLDLPHSLQVALEGPPERFDLGEVNGYPYGASLGIGLDAAVARAALKAPTFLRGMPRYLYSLFGVLKDLELPYLELEVDGEQVYAGPSLLAAAMNGKTYGGGIPITPWAEPQDGLLALLVAGPFSRLGVLSILPRTLFGRHVGHPRIHRFQGATLRLRFDRPVPAHADGELLEPQSLYEVRVLPKALQVALPKRP